MKLADKITAVVILVILAVMLTMVAVKVSAAEPVPITFTLQQMIDATDRAYKMGRKSGGELAASQFAAELAHQCSLRPANRTLPMKFKDKQGAITTIACHVIAKEF